MGRHIAPCVVHTGGLRPFKRMRQQIMQLIVEVGFGSGLNLPYHDTFKVTRFIGNDPDETMLLLAQRQAGAMPSAMYCLQAGGAESVPLADGFADAAVVAYGL